MRLLRGAVLATTLGVSWAWADESLRVQIAALSHDIAREPARADLWLRRGELHRERGDMTAAMMDFEAATRLDPGMAEIALAQAKAFHQAAAPDRALLALDRYLECRPGSVAGQRLRARIQETLGRHRPAAASLAQAVRFHDPADPPPPEVFLDWARNLAALGPGERRSALGALREGLAMLGPIVTLELAALDLETELGDLPAALHRVDSLATRAERKETWLARRSELLEKLGRVEEAQKACAEALKAMDALPLAHRQTPAMKELRRDVQIRWGRLAVGGPQSVKAPPVAPAPR